ncbi:hypothetical protein [Nonomuraea sp. NPDC049695]
MPTQTVELPKFPLRNDAAPSVTTDAPHERAWRPRFSSPSSK